MQGTSSNHQDVYANQAGEYDRLVKREDYQSNLSSALERHIEPGLGTVVELGAGTGRLTGLIAPLVDSIHAFDLSRSMLKVAQSNLESAGLSNWTAAVADHRRVPVASEAADLVVSGWSIVYMYRWHGATWRDELKSAFAEIRRLLRPGGKLVLFETLGTGFETPHPPENLEPYYQFLEREGLSSDWIRTDYRFESQAEAETLASFFYGDPMIERLISFYGAVILPECTGIWWITV